MKKAREFFTAEVASPARDDTPKSSFVSGHDFSRADMGVFNLRLAKATSLGLTVCKPYGDNKRFDFVVESAGRTSRVQVKSCWRRGQWRGYPARACNSRRPYRHGEIDFIVLYVVPKDVWYVIPAAAIANTWLVVYPTVRRSRGKFEKYREAWNLLKGSG